MSWLKKNQEDKDELSSSALSLHINLTPKVFVAIIKIILITNIFVIWTTSFPGEKSSPGEKNYPLQTKELGKPSCEKDDPIFSIFPERLFEKSELLLKVDLDPK